MKYRLLAYGLLALVIIAVAGFIGRASGRRAELQLKAEINEANARAALVYARMRTAEAQVATLRTQAIEARTRRLGSQVDTSLFRVRVELDSARAVLADTLATVERLRATLSETTEHTALLTQTVAAYRGTVDSLMATSLIERQALYNALYAKDTALVAMTVAMESYKSAATCRVLWFRCPTRTQAAVGGAILGAVTVLVVTK